MKKLLLILTLLVSAPTFAQTTANLSVTDTPDNQQWANGTWTVKVVAAPGSGSLGPFNVISGGGSTAQQSGALSGTGTASMNLPASINIAPAGTIWQFTVCPQVSSGCFQSNVTITTSSPQTVALTPPSIRINLITAAPPISAYSTGEVTGAALGSQFFLIGTGLQVCTAVTGNTCNTWSSAGGGGITSVASLPATCTPGVTQPVLLSVPPFGIYYCGPAVNQWSGASDALKGTSCSGCKADEQFVTDATLTNGSSNVTTSGSDIAFTSADNGKTCWGTSGGGVVAAMRAGTLSLAEGTFTQTGAHTGTCSTTAGATATGAANNFFSWGTNDSAAMQATYDTINIAGGVCGTLLLPGHPFFVDTAWHASAAPLCQEAISGTGDSGLAITGFGILSSLMVVGPSFNPATQCIGNSSTTCFFGGPGISISNFGIFGGFRADCPATFNGLSLIGQGNDSNASLIYAAGWCAGNTNTSVGLKTIFGGAQQRLSFDGFGNLALQIAGSTFIENSFFGDSTAIVVCGGPFTSTANVYADAAAATVLMLGNTGCVFKSSNDTVLNIGNEAFIGIKMLAGTAYLVNFTDDVSNSTTALAAWANGGTINALNSTFKTGSSGSSDVLVSGAGATYNDEGGNTYAAKGINLFDQNSKLIADGMTLTGACTGVATGASTLGLYGTGANVVATTCTSVLIGTGVVMSSARTLTNLYVTNTTGGVNASSGVVTVLKNGGATALTCTIGTGTVGCSDNLTAHNVSVVAGDLISIQFTTQAAETLAGVKAVVKWN